MRRRLRVGLGITGTIVTFILLVATASASSPRYCGTVKYRYQGTTYRDNVFVTTGKVSCRGARGADYENETGAATSPTPGWTCSFENEGLWLVCKGARSTVRGVPYAGGPSLPKQPRYCGIATYQDSRIDLLRQGERVGGAGLLRRSTSYRSHSSSGAPGKVPHIPGWQCNYDSRWDSWVLCVSPTSILRGVSVHPATPATPATPPTRRR